jgi:hypothetical protein
MCLDTGTTVFLQNTKKCHYIFIGEHTRSLKDLDLFYNFYKPWYENHASRSNQAPVIPTRPSQTWQPRDTCSCRIQLKVEPISFTPDILFVPQHGLSSRRESGGQHSFSDRRYAGVWGAWRTLSRGGCSTVSGSPHPPHGAGVTSGTNLLTELIPSWEAASCAATQELPSTLWNPKVHYRSLRNASCCVLILYIELYFPVRHNNIPVNSLTYH